MTIQRDLTEGLLVGLYRRLGPRLMLGLLESLASDETNNFRMCEDFCLSLHLIRVLRLRPDYCLGWLVRRIHSDELGRISLFQKLEHQKDRLTDRRIFPN